MLTISTFPEALIALEKHTGRAWTASELLDVATMYNLKLHAAPPITAQTAIHGVVKGRLEEKFRLSRGHALLAVLFPKQVAQLSIAGETTTMHPLASRMEGEGEYHWFTEPVLVTREQVRIHAETLWKILELWVEAQSGPWIDDETVPGGKRRHRGPSWMFPTITQPSAAVKQAPPALSKAFPNPSDDDWKGLARAIADEIDETDKKAGAHDSVTGVSRRVESKMREQKKYGPRGPLSASTILREALQGGKWSRKL